MYGAQVLAAGYGTTNLTAMPSLNASTVTKTSANSLVFSGTASTGTVTMVPFYQMHKQRYNVYWKLTNVPTPTAISPLTVVNAISRIAPVVQVSHAKIFVSVNSKMEHSGIIQMRLYGLNGKALGLLATPLGSGQQRTAFDVPKNLIGMQTVLYCIKAGNEEFRGRLLVCR
jgi:hypothetical protein